MKTALDCIEALLAHEVDGHWAEYLTQGATKQCLVAEILQELGFPCRAVRSTFVIEFSDDRPPMWAVASGVEIQHAGKSVVVDLQGNTGKQSIQRAFAKSQNAKPRKHAPWSKRDEAWELMQHVPNVASIVDEAYAKQKDKGLCLLQEAVALHANTPASPGSFRKPRF